MQENDSSTLHYRVHVRTMTDRTALPACLCLYIQPTATEIEAIKEELVQEMVEKVLEVRVQDVVRRPSLRTKALGKSLVGNSSSSPSLTLQQQLICCDFAKPCSNSEVQHRYLEVVAADC